MFHVITVICVCRTASRSPKALSLQSNVVVTDTLYPLDATPRVSNLGGNLSSAYVTDTANNQQSNDQSINKRMENNNVIKQKITQSSENETKQSEEYVQPKKKRKRKQVIKQNNNQRINEVLQCVMIKNKKLVINQLQFNLKQIIDDKNINTFCIDNKNYSICRLRFDHNSVYNALFTMIMHWKIETTGKSNYHIPFYMQNLINAKMGELLHLKTKWIQEAFARYTNCTSFTQMRYYSRNLKKQNTEGNMLSILVFCSIFNSHVKVSYTDENDNYCCISTEQIFDSFTSRPNFDIKYTGNIGFTLKYLRNHVNDKPTIKNNYFYFSDETEYMKYITQNNLKKILEKIKKVAIGQLLLQTREKLKKLEICNKNNKKNL